MKRFLLLVAAAAMTFAAGCSKYKYQSVEGDPLKTRIYTLDNGLRVYMSVNRETPRIQTIIAVRVGGKNDPAETTGLAHYFEHLMFKGTDKFGTQDYQAEKPLLDEIERLFELYRNTSDAAERTRIYAVIDSVSNEASKLAIPNEYDKLMAAIGAEGTNAWTSHDETCYTEDIPSNQIENWARIQADRFANAVIRGFHTELETVYEEYNMSLTDDTDKAYEAISSLLFPTHPYGQHTVLGTQEHLKNPSITNIKEYFKTYYVPNNIAICMSGDFDPDKTIAIIDKYFGALKPNDDLPQFAFEPAEPLTAPAVTEVLGNESEFIYMGWRTGGARSEDAEMAQIVSRILKNGKCGLIDTDLLQSQKIISCGAFNLRQADLGAIVAYADPKEGQTLEQARDLILAEVSKLRNGLFDEEILTSTIANFKREQMQMFESNRSCVQFFVSSFINGTEWADEVASLDRMSKITREQVVAWASDKLRDDNYAIVYKRKGEDKNQKKIDKPHITPIATNRDAVSDYLTEVKNSPVAPIKPVFVDFSRDMSVGSTANGLEVLYKHNQTNGLFSLTYLYQLDSYDPVMDFATKYFSLLGTADKSLDQIQRQFYDLACNFNITTAGDRIYVVISGLDENIDKAMALAEEYLNGVEGNDQVLAELKNDTFKERSDSKHSQQANFASMQKYAIYGADYIRNTTLSNDGIAALTSDSLTDKIKSLAGLRHSILYYGPMSQKALIAKLDAGHITAETLSDPDVDRTAALPQQVDDNKVLLVQYDAKQIYYTQYSKDAEDNFSTDNDALVEMYNGYFGNGMNGIVFQEMREARGLAYTARASYRDMTYPEQGYVFSAFIATQNDKMQQAIEAFDQIIENMPRSQAAFDIAKQSALATMATNRITKSGVLWAYVNNRMKGIRGDRNKALYEQLQSITLDDVMQFQQERIKGRKYTYCILGDQNDLDMDYLRTLGPVEILSQEQIFGF